MICNNETYLILFVSTEICYTVFFEQFIIILLCKPLLPITKGIIFYSIQNMIQFILHCNVISNAKMLFRPKNMLQSQKCNRNTLIELRGNFNKTGKIHLKYIYSTNKTLFFQSWLPSQFSEQSFGSQRMHKYF